MPALRSCGPLSLHLSVSLRHVAHSLGTPTHPFAGIVGHSTCHTRGRDILSWKMLRALLQFTWQASAADPTGIETTWLILQATFSFSCSCC